MEVMMQAYDKTESINLDFERPSFILPGFPDGFFDSQPTDMPDTSRRAEATGTSCQGNQCAPDPSQQPLVMTDVEYSDEEDHSIEHHVPDMFYGACPQQDPPPSDKVVATVLRTSTDGERSRSDQRRLKGGVDGDAHILDYNQKKSDGGVKEKDVMVDKQPSKMQKVPASRQPKGVQKTTKVAAEAAQGNGKTVAVVLGDTSASKKKTLVDCVDHNKASGKATLDGVVKGKTIVVTVKQPPKMQTAAALSKGKGVSLTGETQLIGGKVDAACTVKGKVKKSQLSVWMIKGS
ncbi:uncharacterized protein LOC121763085 isoform X2 [Salvia splendens]|uniref:uncharacterized protein LOC121763085 isoform X2 n=1 Tax=Salvia splendens TaxID=180675 RepID=UPI001C269546|nr:uncharacterized protein LOC121763085 isoform X2 [Salvia splendens]